MKALILSRGHGTRLRPLTYSQQKQLFEDERGYFMETYKKTDFERAGIKASFV